MNLYGHPLMDWEQFIHYDSYVEFGWFGFHIATVVLLFIPLLFIWWRARSHGIWGFIIAMSGAALNIHIFETFHALTMFIYLGYTGITVLVNMAIIFLVGMFLYMIMKPKLGVFSPDNRSLVCLAVLVVAFSILGASGFFSDYPYSIKWEWELLFAKLATGALICSLFLGEVKENETRKV